MFLNGSPDFTSASPIYMHTETGSCSQSVVNGIFILNIPHVLFVKFETDPKGIWAWIPHHRDSSKHSCLFYLLSSLIGLQQQTEQQWEWQMVGVEKFDISKQSQTFISVCMHVRLSEMLHISLYSARVRLMEYVFCKWIGLIRVAKHKVFCLSRRGQWNEMDGCRFPQLDPMIPVTYAEWWRLCR